MTCEYGVKVGKNGIYRQLPSIMKAASIAGVSKEPIIDPIARRFISNSLVAIHTAHSERYRSADSEIDSRKNIDIIQLFNYLLVITSSKL